MKPKPDQSLPPKGHPLARRLQPAVPVTAKSSRFVPRPQRPQQNRRPSRSGR